MKMQADRLEAPNAISRHSPQGVVVNGVELRSSVIVPWQGAVTVWSPADFDALDEASFEELVALGPELVIFGSGSRLRFPKPAWLKPLMSRRIGFEAMDTAAACRTYNVLLAESRSVLAALLFERGG
jgi:uncharacterized protein